MGNTIVAQNKKLINQHDSPPKTQSCNCRNINSCSLSGDCREKNIIYQATVRSNNSIMNYFGLCGMRNRFYNPILQSHALLKKPFKMQSYQTLQICMGMQRSRINPFHPLEIRLSRIVIQTRE